MRSYLLAGAAFAAFFSAAHAADPNPSQFGWRSDYAAARAEAGRLGKPLLVVFRCER